MLEAMDRNESPTLRASDAQLLPHAGVANAIRLQMHPRCVVCGRNSALGLELEFAVRDDGAVECQLPLMQAFEGYADQLHGGVVALCLDGAMTNCLFAHGHKAVTAKLEVRYRHPVSTNREALLRAWCVRSRPPLRLVRAELVQDGQAKAIAFARFIDRERKSP